ncbi:MAG: glycosyltransferase [Alphaproteobacteria bacterium]
MSTASVDTLAKAQGIEWLYALVLYGAIMVSCLLLASGDARVIPYGALLTMGFIGFWRYAWLMLHALRAVTYVRGHFPLYRRAADHYRNHLPLSHYPSVGFIVPSYQMPDFMFERVFAALFVEAHQYPGPIAIIAAVTTQQEATWLQDHAFIYCQNKPTLIFDVFLQKGTGKRDAMAEALTRLKAHGPMDRVILMDGDTVIQPKTLKKLVGFFETQPNLGAVTIDNHPVCVNNHRLIQPWYSLRMIQRHWLMASMSVSRCLLVLTGRLSMFRGSLAYDDGFLQAIATDTLDHWRHGRLTMLTGDDKSTWFYTLKQGWSMLYIPDIACESLETPVSPHFLTHVRSLMIRWFGNMMRHSNPALALGPKNMPFFVWWCLLDQRISPWTSLIGPMGAIFLALIYHSALIPFYLLWVLISRTAWAVVMTQMRGRFHPYFPALLFFGQVYGAVIKIHTTFRLHRQQWTRQNPKKSKETTEQRSVAMMLEATSYGAFLFAMAVASKALIMRL